MSYPRLAARLYGQPLFLYPEKAKLIEEVFRTHLLGGSAKPLAMDDDYADGESEEERAARVHDGRVRQYAGIKLQRRDDKPYALTQNGIALVPIMGTLIQRGSWMDSMSGLTSYGEISAMLDRAALDSDVRGVLLEIDSPGGEIAGAFELSGRILAMRDTKPTWAHANEAAFSSGYLQMSAAARAYTPKTGMVGNVGTLMIHVDQSKADEKRGLAYTFIFAGDKKVEGNSHEPLSASARGFLQGEVDRMYGMFVDAVGGYRGIGADAVRATQAAVFNADAAKEARFIDGIATFAETVALLEAEANKFSGTRPTAGPGMQSNQKENHMKAASPAATRILAALSISMESVSEAAGASLEGVLASVGESVRVLALAEGEKAGEAKGLTAGIKAERDRVKSILGCDEAKTRGKLATTLATETDNTPDQAKKLLASAQPEGTPSPMRQAMSNLRNPEVGTGGGAADNDEDADAMARRVAGVVEPKRAQ